MFFYIKSLNTFATWIFKYILVFIKIFDNSNILEPINRKFNGLNFYNSQIHIAIHLFFFFYGAFLYIFGEYTKVICSKCRAIFLCFKTYWKYKGLPIPIQLRRYNLIF